MTKKKQYYKDKHGWKGRDKWNCKLCNFDSLSEEKMIQHINEMHAPAPEPKKPEKKPMTDRFGNYLVDQYGNTIYKEI